jgi:precorrin-2 dehydrogenase/sirohydrochlorin ferrochelatase
MPLRGCIGRFDASESTLDFIIPSYFRKGDLVFAVSTGGVSPAFARKIKSKFQKQLGEEYATLLALIGKVRSTLKEKGIKVNSRRWQDALDLDSLIQLVKAGKSQKVKTALLDKLNPSKRT